jgi:glycosyltransferase involved in cell wall biosynthesis
MRILYLTHYFPPEGNAPASRALEMGRCWARAGHEVQVITCVPNVPDGKAYPGYRNRLVQRQRIDGMDVTRVWTYLAANRGKAKRIANYLSYMASATIASTLVRRPDVVLATSPQFFCGWAGVLASRLRRLPFILEIRDLWPESIAALGAMTSACALDVLSKLERRMYQQADRIVTVGEGYKQRLIGRGVSESKIDIVCNGVDFDLFSPRKSQERIRARWGLGDAFVCAYIGTIGMCAGLEVVLAAAHKLRQQNRRDVKFLLVGDGAQREPLARRASDEGLDNVVFTGRRDKREIPDLLATSDACLVHLQDKELFRSVYPSKIFEAAAMARPILLGVEGAAARLLSGPGAGLCFEPENADALLAGIEQLQGDPVASGEMGRRAWRWVRRDFDRRDLAAAYLEILRDTIAAKRGFGVELHGGLASPDARGFRLLEGSSPAFHRGRHVA